MTSVQSSAVADAGALDAPALLADLRAHHASGATRSLEWRIRQLRALARLLEEREDDLTAAIGADLGRTPFDSWFGDVASTKGEIAYALKNLKRWVRPRRQRVPLTQLPATARIQYEPLGVVLIIGPWNYPIFLTLSPLVAALAAGNCVVVKPSELAPASSEVLTRLLPAYLDPDAVRVVEGDAAVTQQLLAAGFDHALFTGGTEIGRKIMAAAAPSLTPVTLELGGKSPVIVTADADLAIVARRLAWVKFMNSGQTCIAPDYVLVHESVRDELVAQLRIAIADQQRETPEAGLPIVNRRQFDRLRSYLDASRGEVVIGGTVEEASLRIAPTVVVGPDAEEPMMAEEIFGPILPILTVSSPEEAVRVVNARPKPLALYVFSRDKAVARRLVEAIPAGGAVVNHIALHCLTPTLPFGGVGASGMGAYHGEWGFQALSHRKAVLVKTFSPDLSIMYPPYDEKAQRLMRRLF